MNKKQIIYMNKSIIQEVLIKARQLFHPKLMEDIIGPETFHLAHLIWEDEDFQGSLGIFYSHKEQKIHLKREEIEKILTSGRLEKEATKHGKLTFILDDYKEKSITLESGKVMIYSDKEDEKGCD